MGRGGAGWGGVGRGGAEGTASRRHLGHLEGFHLARGCRQALKMCVLNQHNLPWPFVTFIHRLRS